MLALAEIALKDPETLRDHCAKIATTRTACLILGQVLTTPHAGNSKDRLLVCCLASSEGLRPRISSKMQFKRTFQRPQLLWSGLPHARKGPTVRTYPKSGPVASILEGLAQERACPKDLEGPVPRSGLSQAF